MKRVTAIDLFFSSSNENIVQSSARFLIEYRQMEQRVRLDVPTLADPAIRDLLHESDLFVRSFNILSVMEPLASRQLKLRHGTKQGKTVSTVI